MGLAPSFHQRSFDDLGAPLSEVTFCVVDLETTGGSPHTCQITEVGAVKVRGGERLGTFQTLVNPGVPIPPEITLLTGITERMVGPAPLIDEVLPAFLEFAAGTVIVGHNIRFDLSFLRAAAERLGYERLGLKAIDTCALARRLVRDEVPNCRLSTLAAHFRANVTPNHRALEDALATTDVLHSLLERAGSLGVLALDDLIELPTISGHPQLAKLKLAQGLPRAPGVYLFRDRDGRVLYVGKAVDLRRRVRSYFSSDDRRKIGPLLRETAAIDHVVCAGDLDASVLEVRLIHRLMPRYNRQAKGWRRYAYVKLTADEVFPRLSVVRSVKPGDGAIHLGPLPSTGAARLVADAIEEAVPIRRCTLRTTRGTRVTSPCGPAQLGVAACPCSGDTCAAAYETIVDTVVRGLTGEPGLLLGPLEAKMGALSQTRRFEEAAAVRDRANALSRALFRQRRFDALRSAGRIDVELPDRCFSAVIDRGRLVSAWAPELADVGAANPRRLPETARALGDGAGQHALPGLDPHLDDPVPDDGPLPPQFADELACVGAWLDAQAGQLRLVSAGGWSEALPRLRRYEPRPAR